MLFNIHKVYTIYDYGDKGQSMVEIQKESPESVDITAGQRSLLVGSPEGSKVEYTPNPVELIDANKSFRFSTTIDQNSAVYLYLEPGYILDQIETNPEQVDQDLLLEEFNHSSRLIFCFFVSQKGQLTIRGRKTKDTTVRKKLIQSPKDIVLRRVLLQRCNLDYKLDLIRNKEFLTIDEIATYLGLNKRTIQNKISQGKFLKPKSLGGTLVWDKKEFLEWCSRQ